jgi:hypothetical protein
VRLSARALPAVTCIAPIESGDLQDHDRTMELLADIGQKSVKAGPAGDSSAPWNTFLGWPLGRWARQLPEWRATGFGNGPNSATFRRTPMFESTDNLDDAPKQRRPKNSLSNPPRASRTTARRDKKTRTSVGGTHQRRNKHWTW